MGELKEKLKAGIPCEVPLSKAEYATIALRGWLCFPSFAILGPANGGWVCFVANDDNKEKTDEN
jgi:hypothetical protein